MSKPWSPRALPLPQAPGSGDIGQEHLIHYQATTGSGQAQPSAVPGLSQQFHTWSSRAQPSSHYAL